MSMMPVEYGQNVVAKVVSVQLAGLAIRLIKNVFPAATERRWVTGIDQRAKLAGFSAGAGWKCRRETFAVFAKANLNRRDR